MADLQQKDKEQGIEYTIYTFDAPEAGEKSHNRWEKKAVQKEMTTALAQAEKMFRSGKYQKVEVKQKYFDKKSDRNIDLTLKVYEAGKGLEVNAALIFIFAVLCGVTAFAVTYYLTN